MSGDAERRNPEGPAVAIVTGASSGIGAATAQALSSCGYHVFLGARRLDRLEEIASTTGGTAIPLDVSVEASVESFFSTVERTADRVDVLVNNAGGAHGLAAIEAIAENDVIETWQANVLGLIQVTKRCLPLLRKSSQGHIVNIGSVAGFETYEGGAAYSAAKHAVRAISKTLRLELNGEPLRLTEVDPGITRTEFSKVRFGADVVAAERVYLGIEPLTALDVAECVVFAVTRPPHVNIDEIVIRPRAQATVYKVARREASL